MNRAISEEEKKLLLKNANIPDMRLDDIIFHIKRHITQNGFTTQAKSLPNSEAYIWAHETAPGIIWLWSE